ncbi:hypothetical protein FcAc13_05140 [Frischella sp. Ac13]|uniref:Uncharacterized protein n=1 Tax=Frischella japonica TaxID=2741544 RepID=A0ABR7QWW0_9GAMM|nr:hypothetical protein [Frischella japonica]MBC9130692.1 hypothetical protein [Frischella japonica]
MTLDEFLNTNRAKKNALYRTFNRIICKDGFTFSIQCGSLFYSEPRREFKAAEKYSAFELGFPSHADELISEYAEDEQKPTRTVYAYVPREVVEQLINNHGGIKNDYSPF